MDAPRTATSSRVRARNCQGATVLPCALARLGDHSTRRAGLR
jgi:hypothetical protein